MAGHRFTALFIPAAGGDVVVTPGAATMGLAAFGSTVNGSLSITPGAAALGLTSAGSFAFGSLSVTPGAAILGLSAFGERVLGSFTVVPGSAPFGVTSSGGFSLGSLSKSGTAPFGLTAALGDIVLGPLTITPGAAALGIAAFGSFIGGSVLVVPGAAKFGLSAFGSIILGGTPFDYGGCKIVNSDLIGEIIATSKAINTDWFAPDVEFAITPVIINDSAKHTLGIMVATATVVNLILTPNGSSAQPGKLNGGSALVADVWYHFDVFLAPGDVYNIQHATTTQEVTCRIFDTTRISTT